MAVFNKIKINDIKRVISKVGFSIFPSLILLILLSNPVFADDTTEVNDVLRNISNSASNLPGLIAVISYLIGLGLCVSAILKFKDHVENPSQTPIRTPIIRLLIGGSMFALPIVYEAMLTAINGGEVTDFDPETTLGISVSSFVGDIAGFGVLMDFNVVLANIMDATENFPAIVSVAAYLLGLILGVWGLLKIKDHVENPDQNPLKDGVVRLFVGGALFGLPTIYDAMFYAIYGEGPGILGELGSLLGALGALYSGYAGLGSNAFCDPTGGILDTLIGGGATLGSSICGVIVHTAAFPAFLMAVGYAIGLVLGFWGVLKLRDHVLDPRQTSLWDGLSRLIAGGSFFALPALAEVARSTVAPGVLEGPAEFPISSQGYREQIGECTGLDGALACAMTDVLGPMHSVINLFTFCAGVIFIMVGISRLMKSAQDGPKGPGGLGTIMTFLCGGALISYNELIRAFTGSLAVGTLASFGPRTRTYVELSYDDGLSGDELMHAYTVISAILKFMIIIGLISFVRGIFIIRDVSEGSQQASLMAGITHLVAGVLAINIGAVVELVQTTLGITEFGVTFR